MKSHFILIIFFLVISSCTFNQKNAAEKNAVLFPDSLTGLITQDEYMNGWRPLFNKVSLEGWKGFLKSGPVPGWYVKDSIMITKGDSLINPGDLISIQQFEDFELYIEWAISWQGNSGIFFHCLENSWAAWAMGPEFSIMDQSNLDPMENIYRTAANYGMHPPQIDCIEPQGAFNTSKIKVKDAKVEHWLNGQKVVEYELWSDDWYKTVAHSKWKEYPLYGRPIKGSIGFQGHGFETKFRNMKIRDLTDIGEPLLSLIKGNKWQFKGNNNVILNNDKITLKGYKSGIQGVITNNRLDNNFILRLKFVPKSQNALLLCFKSNEKLQILTEVNYSKESQLIIQEEGFFVILTSSENDPIRAEQWNDLIIRRKGDQILIWLNNNMIIEKNHNIIPENLEYFGIELRDSSDNEVSLRSMFFRELF